MNPKPAAKPTPKPAPKVHNHDTVATNEMVHVGDVRMSQSGELSMVLGKDGNLVLTGRGKMLWATGTTGKPAVSWKQNWDGNLLLLDANGHTVWQNAAGSSKNKDCIFVLQDDGNAVTYSHKQVKPGNSVWSTNTFLFKQGSLKGLGKKDDHGGINVGDIAAIAVGLPPGILHVAPGASKWAEHAVQTAGRGVGSGIDFVSKATGDLASAVGKVPFVGPLFSGLVDVSLGGPWHMASDVVHGVPLDKAISRELKRQLKDFKEIGPYAQMVFSVIPGFGPFVAGAIGAGLALANGQPLSEALIEGVEGMAPGGPLVHMALAMAVKTVSIATSPGGFKNFHGLQTLAEIGVAALPVSKQVQDMIDGGITVVANLASGERLDQALIDGAVRALPLDEMGPVAKQAVLAAAQTVKDVARGEKIDHALIDGGLKAIPVNSLPIPDAAKKALNSVVDAGIRISNGQHVDAVLLAEAVKNIPVKQLGALTQQAIGHVTEIAQGMLKQSTAAQTIVNLGQKFLVDTKKITKQVSDGLKVGIAMGHGQGLQNIVTASIKTGDTVAKLAVAGAAKVKSDAVIGAALKAVPPNGVNGFQVGMGLVQTQVGLQQLMAVRDSLPPADKQGFDMAVSLHTGRVTTAPPAGPPAAQAAYAITHGVMGAPPDNKAAIVTTLSDDPAAKAGVALALEAITTARASFWHQLLQWLGFERKTA